MQPEKLDEAITTVMTEIALLTEPKRADDFKVYLKQMFNSPMPDDVDIATIGRNTKQILQLRAQGLLWCGPILENYALYHPKVVCEALQAIPYAATPFMALRKRILCGCTRPEYYRLMTQEEFIEYVLGKVDSITEEIERYLTRLNSENRKFDAHSMVLILGAVRNKKVLEEFSKILLLLDPVYPAYLMFAKSVDNILQLR